MPKGFGMDQPVQAVYERGNSPQDRTEAIDSLLARLKRLGGSGQRMGGSGQRMEGSLARPRPNVAGRQILLSSPALP